MSLLDLQIASLLRTGILDSEVGAVVLSEKRTPLPAPRVLPRFDVDKFAFEHEQRKNPTRFHGTKAQKKQLRKARTQMKLAEGDEK